MQIKQEQIYLVKNEKSKLSILLEVEFGEPADSYVMYNGKEHALFYHHENDMIVLDFFPEGARSALSKAKEVGIVETLSDAQTVIRDYKVPVKHVEKYPFDVSKYIEVPKAS